MTFRENTATNGYYLCSDCQNRTFDVLRKEGLFHCSRVDLIVCKVGVCNGFIERRSEDDG